MPPRHPFPDLWLISDARNDAVLEDTLRRLPRGSGFVFRHYHLAPAERRVRYEALARIARRRGHLVILAGGTDTARRWRADGAYGARLKRQAGLLRIATAHSLRELGKARADAAMLSPVFATRSHPGARTLGPLRFRLLAQRAGMPVIALGGMTPRNARRLKVSAWAAIDGLCHKGISGDKTTHRIPKDS